MESLFLDAAKRRGGARHHELAFVDFGFGFHAHPPMDVLAASGR